MCTEGIAKQVPRQVLPAHVKPVNYNVAITPVFEEPFQYTGSVKIQLLVVESTKVVVCNAKELDVDRAIINSKEAENIVLDGKKETVSFHFADELQKGSLITMQVFFKGVHNNSMAGFYRSQYTDATTGDKKFLVVTQFEATDCRRCFPSWDEPNLKATFDVSLVIPKDRIALSNMPVISETKSGETKTVTFDTTPIMSTYLLAMCVGEFEFLEETAKPSQPASAKPIVCRTYTLPGQKEMGHFGLGVCVKTLEFFSEYFDVAYPLPKMDMIAIPDFGAGAMENWGLVTYRETALLYDPAKSSAKAKERVAYVVGHELAHQWFGNLVTMDWWSELWLNEGFATFVGWLAVDHLFPEWNVFTSFLIGDYSSGVELDSLRSSHPIEVDVNSASEINQIFDAISYSKGASVIRMLNSSIGGEVFRKGVVAYLKRHSYQNAKTVDLWKALSESSGSDVQGMMYTWTREVGYPMVTIENALYDDSKKEMTLTLSQKRFLSSGDLTPEEEAASPLWNIPIGVITSSSKEVMVRRLTEKKGTITFPFSNAPNSYWKLNADVTGFYRVLYTSEQLSSLGKALSHNISGFSTQDRIGLVTDAFAFARAGLSGTVDALALLTHYKKESNQMVLEGVAQRLSSLKNAFWKDEEAYKGLLKIQGALFVPMIKEVGYEYGDGEDQLTVLKRNLVISNAAASGDKDVVHELTDRFRKYIAGDKNAFHANLRESVFRTVLFYSTSPAEDFQHVLDIYQTATAADERISALACLGATNDLGIVDRILNKITLDSSIVKLQDTMYPVNSIGALSPKRKEVVEILWKWLETNWDQLHHLLSPSLSLLGRITQACISYNLGDDFAKTVEAWASGTDCTTDEDRELRLSQMMSVKRPLEQALETLKGNTVWYEREKKQVVEYFKTL